MLRPRTRHLLLPSMLLVPLLAAACASKGTDLSAHRQPITMGDPVEGEAYGTVGMLVAHANVSVDGAEAEDRNLGICTGTLISRTAVLTAEHCVSAALLEQSLDEARDAEGKPRNIVLQGEIGFRFTFARALADVMAGTADMIEVTSVDEHGEFAPLNDPRSAYRPAPAQWNDIAILHLARSVKDHPLQKLASTELVDSLIANEDTLYRAAGYGLTDDKDQMSAGTLTSGVSHLGKVGPFELTAGANDRQQACRGDSGGPIFTDETDGFQMGIASRIDRPFSRADFMSTEPPPCETGLAYTRVDAFLGWIADRVSDLPAPSDETEEDAGVDAGPEDSGMTDSKVHVSGGGGCSVAATVAATPSTFAMLLLGLSLALRRRDRK